MSRVVEGEQGRVQAPAEELKQALVERGVDTGLLKAGYLHLDADDGEAKAQYVAGTWTVRYRRSAGGYWQEIAADTQSAADLICRLQEEEGS